MKASALVLVFGLGTLGFSGLCLAMARHYRVVFGPPPPPGRTAVLRAAGWGLLVLSLALSGTLEGWGIGVVQWLGVLTAAALTLVVALSYCPRAVPWIATLSAAVAAGAIVPFLAAAP